MVNAKGIWAAAYSLVTIGAGYAYCGLVWRATLTLLGGFALVFLFSYLAIFSAWFIATAFALGIVFTLVTVMDSFRCAISSTAKPRPLFAAVYILASYLIFQYAYLPSRRVAIYVTPSILMEPTLLRGDHFVLDRFYADFKAGDIVVAELEDQSLVVRRILELKSTSVIVTTDSKAHSRTKEIPLAALHGKVLYVVYSENPEGWMAEMDRLFVAVN